MSFSNTACQQAQALLTEQSMALPSEEFLFNPDDEVLLVQHLAGCEDCRTYQNSMKHLTNSLRNLDTVPVPVGLMDRIMQNIEQEESPKTTQTGTPKKHAKKQFGLRPMMAVAASMLLLALVFPMLQNSEKEALTESHPTVATSQPTTPQPSTPNVAIQKTSAESVLTAPSQRIASASSPHTKPASQTVQVDTSQIASAKPDAELVDEELAFAGERDADSSDVYADPVGNLVGF